MPIPTVKVIDPIHLFLSKRHCLLNLPKADRQDERHVRMMALIVQEYLSLLIGDVGKETLSGRALLKEIKLVKKIASTAICRSAMAKAGQRLERSGVAFWLCRNPDGGAPPEDCPKFAVYRASGGDKLNA